MNISENSREYRCSNPNSKRHHKEKADEFSLIHIDMVVLEFSLKRILNPAGNEYREPCIHFQSPSKVGLEDFIIPRNMNCPTMMNPSMPQKTHSVIAIWGNVD